MSRDPAPCRVALSRFSGALLLSLLGSAGPDVAATTTDGSPREICPGTAGGAPGSRVAVPVALDDGGGVAGLQVEIHYDSALLAPVGVRLGADTAAASGWSVDSGLLGAGVLVVLAYSSPPTGLAPGAREVALVDFEVTATFPIGQRPFPIGDCVLGDVNGVAIPCGICPQPGVDGAVPRFAVTVVDDGPEFVPSRPAVEQGDWVIWRNAGASRPHTTTSGIRDPLRGTCAADGVWRGELRPGGRFARRFPEPPSTLLPFYCEPDCLAGQTGEVRVTDAIRLDVAVLGGASLLTWVGGSGLYRLHRADDPGFLGAGARAFTPDGGDTGTTFNDSELPAPGMTFFYLVTNLP